MNEQEFENCLDRFGGELTRWPEQQRVEASALIESNESARKLLHTQLELDALLLEAMTVPEPFGLERKILDRSRAIKFDLNNWLQFIWKPAFAAAISLGFGFYLGAASQDFPAAIEDDLTDVTFYDYESWSGDGSNGA